MALPPLTENVIEITLTPFLGIELLPDNTPGWGLVQNNNWIRIENVVQAQSEEISVIRATTDNAVANLTEDFADLRSDVQNEAILRSQADADLQAQIPQGLVGGVRFTNRALSPATVTLAHNLGAIPAVRVVDETTKLDVTNHYDTVITHPTNDQVSVRVGVTGTYTVICVG